MDRTRLARRMDEAGFSVERLAYVTGTCASTVRRRRDEGIERASVRNALKAARALRCSVEDIAGRCR